MKKKKLQVFMLFILIMQSFGSVVNAFAVTEDEASYDEQTTNDEDNQAQQTEETSVVEEPTATVSSEGQETSVDSEEVSTDSQALSVENRAQTKTEVGRNITDELLANMTITTMEGIEFSKEIETRILNTTPVIAKLAFVIENADYEAGTSYQIKLPEHLGYSNIGGEVANIGASWSVDADSKMLTITFNQYVSDAQFTLELNTYIFTENQPLVAIETPGKTKNRYLFDVYENVSSINYVETGNNTGIKGNIYYNLDRTLSGSQTLEVLLTDVAGAKLMNASTEPTAIFSYDVSIDGKIIPETKQLLEAGEDYIIVEDTIHRLAVTITNMNKQKAYGLAVDRPVAVESVSAYGYSFYNQYPTTKLGSVRLNQATASEFSAKTSKEQKALKNVSLTLLQSASYSGKGIYYFSIFNIPTQTKAGEQIVLESKNGQLIEEYDFYAYTVENQSVNINDFFDIHVEGTKLIMTATKDNSLRISTKKFVIPFDEKDITVSVSTPAVAEGKEILLMTDQYIPLLSIVNPNSAETAWGNYDQNGAYSGDTSIMIQGSQSNPIKNMEIKVEHPKYLQLRVPETIYYTYKRGQDFTVITTDEGTTLKFSKPVTISFDLDLGFNYVPDGLATNVGIPMDTIPVTLSADDFGPVSSTIRTGRKIYSERTLQASGNQFLVNARNDSFNSLVVSTRIPLGADVLFDIYDVSNDEVASIYPQYWDRGYYFDKPMNPSSTGYPEITFDEITNSYTFDFGKTSKRYIIEYKNANGWSNANTIYVTGSTAEPLNSNQVLSASVAVKNEKLDILSATQTSHASLKNVTMNSVQTQNINSGTRKIKNPTFDIVLKGTTNAAIDTHSVVIEGVPEEAYRVVATANGAQIVFEEYTLTENIVITYRTISKNAGQIFTETTISSEELAQTDAKTTVASSEVILRFSEGDASGVVALTQAQFHTHVENDTQVNVPGVHFQLMEKITGNIVSFTTDENGQYNFDSIMTGSYVITAINIPVGYTIDDAYLSGKELTITKSHNQFAIPLKKEANLASITAKDSTIYVGTAWNAVDNFNNAIDKEGNPVDFSQITVTGTVDTSQVGDYEIIYSHQEKEAKAVIHVVESQETLVVKDSTIYVGDSWKSADNFVSATTKAGTQLSDLDVDVSGTVDTSKADTYAITYKYDGLVSVAKVTVLGSAVNIEAKDSTIYVGDSWKSTDNFVSATDEKGQSLLIDDVKVSGTVETKKAGVYKVTYGYGDKNSVANITVLDQPTNKITSTKNNTTKQNLPKTAATKTNEQRKYPATGEQVNPLLSLLGLGIASVTILGIARGRKKKAK